jgi:molecular chaperone DnaJ
MLSNELIDIPKSLEVNKNGEVYRKLKGKGHEYLFNSIKYSTDLYVKIVVIKDPYFIKEGDDIVTTNYITVSQYVLGGFIRILTIHGIKEFEIIPFKDKYIIKNYGLDKKGNHIVNIMIRLPKIYSGKQKQIINEIEKFTK